MPRSAPGALDAPLDVFLVRKLGMPGHEGLALGAIASGGMRVLNTQLIESLGLPMEWLEAIEVKERRELERRERAYRGERPPPDVAGSATGRWFRGGVECWNLRDRHIAETLDELLAHLERTSGQVKVVVGAHNSHLGDQRATERAQAGSTSASSWVSATRTKACWGV